MYLTISTTKPAASDLGFLLHKHPGRAQSFDLPVGLAHVFYPVATDARCTAALLLEVDPIGLVRGKKFNGDSGSLSQYVNDRPYAASSMLAVALARVFRTAMTGRCDARPDLIGVALPLQIHVPSLPSSGGAELVHRLFEPLGWQVEARVLPLDPELPDWGGSRYLDLVISATITLAAALSHLYVLLPVMDDAKHYWVTQDEVDKLVRAAEAWLPQHPDRILITNRYLVHQSDLVSSAVNRLATLDEEPAEPAESTAARRTSLGTARKEAVLALLRSTGARRVVDLGCGEGALLRLLIADAAFTEVLGVDVSARALERAEYRLGLDRMPDTQRARLTLIQSSLTYRDERIAGYDAAVLMEVIEHIDPQRLPSLEQAVFGHARPRQVIVTTPNAEHNVRFDALPAGTMRHHDHRFEWTRAQFTAWAECIAEKHGYLVAFSSIGAEDTEVGAATQAAVFTVAATKAVA